MIKPSVSEWFILAQMSPKSRVCQSQVCCLHATHLGSLDFLILVLNTFLCMKSSWSWVVTDEIFLQEDETSLLSKCK